MRRVRFCQGSAELRTEFVFYFLKKKKLKIHTHKRMEVFIPIFDAAGKTPWNLSQKWFSKWGLDQQLQHSLGICLKCRWSGGPAPKPLSQELWEGGPVICFGQPARRFRLRSTVLGGSQPGAVLALLGNSKSRSQLIATGGILQGEAVSKGLKAHHQKLQVDILQAGVYSVVEGLPSLWAHHWFYPWHWGEGKRLPCTLWNAHVKATIPS